MSQSFESTSQPSHLVRQIGLGSSIALVVGSIIGSGIFKSPADVANHLPGPLPMMAVWIVGGIFALCGALTLCEIGGAFPFSGGLYVYLREAYGRLPAYMFGWCNLLLQPASNGAIAIVFSQYAFRMAGFLPGDPVFDRGSVVLAVCAISVITAANVLGVKSGTRIQNVTTLAKAGGLVALIMLAVFISLPHAVGHFTPAVPPGSFSVTSFGLALVSVLYAYDGWMNISYVAGEILEPRKTIPKAIMVGVGIVLCIYLMANVAYLSVFSIAEIGKSQIIAADAMTKMVGAAGGTFIVVAVMLSTFGALNAGVLTTPRIYFALAEDKLFYAGLAKVHPRYKTPYVSVIITGMLGVGYVLLATALSGSKAFNSLIDATVVGNLPFYGLAVGSVFVFRRREKKRRRALPTVEPDSLVDPVEPGHPETHPHAYIPPFHTPLYPFPPALFVASTLFLLGNSLLNTDSRGPSLLVLGVLACSAPLYYLTVGRRR